MNIFELDFKPILPKSVPSKREETPEIRVTRTKNHGKPCTCIYINKAAMKEAGYVVGDRVVAGLAQTNVGLAVKIWKDDARGFRLSPWKTYKIGGEGFGEIDAAHTKSASFNEIPDGRYYGENIGIDGGEIFFYSEEAQ